MYYYQLNGFTGRSELKLFCYASFRTLDNNLFRDTWVKEGDFLYKNFKLNVQQVPNMLNDPMVLVIPLLCLKTFHPSIGHFQNFNVSFI